MESVTNGGDKPRPVPTQTPPPTEIRPPRVKLYAECMTRFGQLGGIRYVKYDIVELKSATLEGEARANPAAWRIFTKEK